MMQNVLSFFIRVFFDPAHTGVHCISLLLKGAVDEWVGMYDWFKVMFASLRNSSNSVYPNLPVSFRVDTKSS